MAGLTLRSVRKSFGETEVIRSVDLNVEHGEFVVFVGRSTRTANDSRTGRGTEMGRPPQ